MARTVRAGVIGVGSMGRNHARVLRELPDVNLVGIVDVDPSLKAVADEFGVPFFSDVKRFLDDASPECVIVAVPSIHHRDVALTVLEQGIACLVEKPLALSVVEGKDIITAATTSGAALMVGHIERFNPVVAALRIYKDQGLLGDIVDIETVRISPHPSRDNDMDVVTDMAIHDIDIMFYLLETDVEDVQCISSRKRAHARILLSFDSGVVGQCAVSWMSPKKIRCLRVFGTEALAELDYITQELTIFKRGSFLKNLDFTQLVLNPMDGEVLRPAVRKQEPLYRELEHFTSCVRDGTEPSPGGEEGLRALEVVERVRSRLSWSAEHA